MDEKQLQFLFDSYAKDKGFADFGEFKSLIGNDASRKIFFDASNEELGFKDFNEFENLIGLKKKELSNNTLSVSGPSFPAGSQSQSQLQSEPDERGKASLELKKALVAQKAARYKELGDINPEGRAISEVNDSYDSILKSPDYATALSRVASLKEDIFANTGGNAELRKELVSKLEKDALGLGQFILKDPKAVQNTEGLTLAQKAGLDFIKIFQPERYDALKERATVRATDASSRVGQQLNNLELEDIGLSVLKTGISDLYKRVEERAKKGELTADSPDVKGINGWVEYVKKVESEREQNYPEALSIKAQQVINDANGERLSALGRFSYNLYKATGGAVEAGVRSLMKRFMNDEDRINSDLRSVEEDAFSFLGSSGQNAAVVGRDYLTVFSDNLKANLDKIDSDTSLSDDQKFFKKSELIKNAGSGEVYSVINPEKSKINLNSESVLGIVTTVVPQILGGLATSYVTGGFGAASKAKQLANLFTTTAITSYGQRYDQEIASGVANPEFYAISGALIDAITEAGFGNDIAQIKKVAGNGVAGKILSKLTDADWNRLMSSRQVTGGLIKAGKEFVGDLVPETAGETLAQFGENVVKGKELTDGLKETAISNIIGLSAFRGPMIPKAAISENIGVKLALYSGGFNKNLTISAIEDQVADGEISRQEGDKRIEAVNKINGIINTMPMFDKNGKPLSDIAKAKYTYNEYIKAEAKSSAANIPSRQAQEMNAAAEKADQENADIIDGQDLSNIESGMAVDQAGQLTINREGIISNAKIETDNIKLAAPDAETGVTLNLDGTKYTGGGLVVPAASMNTTQDQLSADMLADFIDQNKAKLGDGETFKVGYYKFPNSNQVSIDLNIVVDPKYREAALKFGKMAGQESLFDLDTFENVKTGADGSNPRQFTDEEFVQIAKSLREGKVPFERSVAEEIQEEVFGIKPATIDAALSSAVDTAAKSLEKSGIKFSIIDSTTDKSGAARGNQAIFKSDTGEIIIDKSKLKDDIEAGLVVWHEAAHPVMNILRNTDKPLYDAVVNGLQSAAGKNKGVADALGWAQENYGGEATQNDEAIVETIGRINAGIIDINSLDTGLRQKLIDFINAIAKALGLDQIVNDTDIAQFKKTVSEVADALKTGRDVAEIVGEGNVKEYMNNLPDPEAVAAGVYEVQPRISESTIDVYESKEIEDLPRRSLQDLYDQFEGKAVVINSDPTRVGELTLPSGKKIFMYGGPGYLSVKDNVSGNIGFATTQLSKVKSWAKYVKDVFGDKPGVTFVATQAPTSILSNSYSLRYVMDAISMLPKTVLRSSDFKNEFFGKDLVLLKDAFGEKGYNEFVGKYRKADLSDKAVIDGMISEMAYKVGDDNKPASFKARGAFVSNLLGGIAPKASIKTVEGDTGYVSKKPQKFIAKQLMDRLGINAEKVIREIGEPSLVDLYMNEGKWGMAVSGFETDPNMDIDSVQDAGVKHPLFNAKFPGKNPFILDGAYEIDKIFKPVEMTGPSGEPYTKKAAQMLAGSMYVKGMPTEVDGTFEYTKSTPAGGAIQASKANRNLIPESKQKKLTDDGQGNYVFFHRTAGKLNKIDPKKFGSNTATGRDERPGVGISMFYVDNKTGEPGVPSNFIYAVRVPKEKVYPINEDPLSLYDEAKAMFEKDYPGQAFDANKQVGYITKVANEKGFEMTIIDWNIKGTKAPRAQTTITMKPEKYKTEEFVNGSLREVYNPELEKLKPGIKKYQASVGNRLAPNGKPSNLNEKQWNQVRTPEFKAWFGDWENDPENASKVVDENGEPLVVYHGGFDNIESFRPVAYFSDSKIASQFADPMYRFGETGLSEGETPNVTPVFLSLKNPKVLADQDEYESQVDITAVDPVSVFSEGFDSIIFDPSKADPRDDYKYFVSISPNQVKSAIGNSGAFSTTDNRIQASAGNRTAADFGESADPKTKITLNDLGVYPVMSSRELLDSLIKFGGTFDPLLKAIAKKDLSSLQIADMKEITDDPSEAAGGFLSKFTKDVEDRFKGKLYINSESDNLDFSTKNQYYTLTHELMHWVTLDSLDTPVDSPAYDKLRNIYNVLLKNADTTPGFNTFSTYGLTNFNEFMAELFISAKFRDYVKDVMGTNEDLRSINNEPKDLISLLVDYLKGLYAKIFGETGPIDENSPLIDQATKVAKDMFFGNNSQASLGNRKLEQDQDFKLAAYVMRKKAEGTPIAEIAMGIMSAIPGMTVQEVNDLVSNPEQYIRTKFKYLSPALLENLISRAGVKNIYRKPSADTDPAFDSLEVDIDNISFNEQSNFDKIKEKAKEIKTKYFDAAKGLPNWVLALRDISKGIADLEVRKAINTSKELKKVAETIGFTDWNAFTAAMKSLSQPGVMQSMSTAIEPWYANIAAERKQLQNAPAIQPAEILALPEEIRPFVFQMRGAIDSLSKELIGSGYVTPEQAMTIEENLGSYANRSYRLFNEKGYKPSPEDRIAATKYLADIYIKQLAKAKAGMLTLKQIETEAIELAKKDIETILAKNVNPYFRKGDSRDTGILKERKDIPEPIRRLMGEYTDPATVFIMTVAKQAALKSSSQYLTGLRNTGLGSIFFEKDDPSRPMSHSVEIATEGSEAKNPLGGLFTTPEIAEAINSVDPTVNDLTNAWMKVVGAVRWGKTVGSVVTQMKNFLSNIGFAVMNGLVFTGENGKALSGAARYYKGEWKGAELDELAQKAMSLGLVNQSVGMSELRQMLGSGDIHNIAVELAVTGKSGKAKNWIGKAIGGLNKSYQLSDDFWKVYAYMNERELLSSAMFGTKYDSLSSDQQASVDIEASERVKNTWPTYDRVWEGAKYVSQRAPIFGNFVSFQAESVRVLGNTVKLAVNDMKSDNPEFQAMGYKRLAGMITYVTLRSAITYAAAHAAGLGVAGLMGMFDDDEEKLKEEGIKNALPGFMRTSDLLVIPQGEKGKFTVFDLSSLDPYGVVFKSLNAMTEGREGIVGDKMEPGIAAAMAEFMSGFLEPEMTFKTMMSIANNTNEKTGGKIFMEDDSRTQAFLESAKYAADQLKPSTIGFVERLMGDNKAAEFSAAVGARPYEVDLTRSFGRIMATNGKNFEDIIREYNRVKYDDKATKEEKKAAELEAEKAMAYYAEKMNKIYNQFLSLGADPKKLEQMIMDKRPVRVTGWNKNIKKAVRTGKIESDKFLK